jgi:hypothetical protein
MLRRRNSDYEPPREYRRTMRRYRAFVLATLLALAWILYRVTSGLIQLVRHG